jgi:hypothetical protein
MVYVVYLSERKLSRGNYTLPGKMEAEKKPFFGRFKGLLWHGFGRFEGSFRPFWVSICTFGANLGRKLHKFGKKIIVIGKLDDYHNKFGYKD